MNRADEGALCWALVDSATAFLRPSIRASLCTKIGAGELESAIKDLLVFYANAGAELPCQLAAPVQSWIQGYTGTDSEPTLQHFYDQITVSTATDQQAPVDDHDPPRRLIAQRSKRPARIRVATKRPTHAVKRVAICGITTSIEDLVRAANEARRIARSTTDVAVREARSARWSWDRISTALGGNPNTETLQRIYGPENSTR